MQQIIDRIPGDVEVEVLSKGAPGPCGGDGASYTARWFATVSDGFDGSGFIETLPEQLSDEFIVADSGVEPIRPAIALNYREITLSVAFYDSDEYHGIYILGISGCAQLPSSAPTRPEMRRDHRGVPAVPAMLATALDQHNRLLSVDAKANGDVMEALRDALEVAAKR